MVSREILSRQLSSLRGIMTVQEWNIFCLAYYDDLNILEICVVMNLDELAVNDILDICLYKAVSILDDNIKYLSRS